MGYFFISQVGFLHIPLGIGTPYGLKTKNEIFYKVEVPLPLIRSGIIAWLSNDSKEFLLDALSFGGNSGSPVFINIDGLIYYIGMVFGHWANTNNQENLGLVKCYWADDVLKVVEKASKLKY